MRFGAYRFSARFLDEARLPEYKGSTFRGVFGHALLSVVCALRRRTCVDCLLANRCLYPYVFETGPFAQVDDSPHDPGGGEGGSSRRRIAARPHPYVIEPLAGEKTRYRAGEVFTFDLLLFGRANDSLPYFIYAFNEVGKSGIGSMVGRQRARFSLLSVAAEDHLLYDGTENRMFAGDFTEDLARLLSPLLGGAFPASPPVPDGAGAVLSSSSLPGRPCGSAGERPSAEQESPGDEPAGMAPAGSAPARSVAAAEPAQPNVALPQTAARWEATGGIALELLTPLRLKYGNHLRASLPFHVLIRAALRRIAALCRYHGDGEPVLDYRGLTARAQNVAADENGLHWFDWERYSSRQEQKMLMGGLVGRVRYTGEVGEFLPLLRFCEKVHLGKQTTFGLGQIIVEK